MGGLYMLVGSMDDRETRSLAERLRERGIGVICAGELGLGNHPRLGALLFACDGLIVAGGIDHSPLCSESLRLAAKLSLKIMDENEALELTYNLAEPL